MIVYATGFRITIPFIDPSLLNWKNGKPELFQNAFHPRYDNLFIAGLVQSDSGLWPLVHYQAQLMARFIRAQQENPRRADKFRRLKSRPDSDQNRPIRYVKTPRHLLEVEHFGYRQRLKELCLQFG